MICKNCNACKKNWYKNSDRYIEKVDYYTCIGVKHPFTIEDINKECTAYDKEYWKNNIKDRQIMNIGWHVINSPEDLPKESKEYFVTFIYGDNGKKAYDTMLSYFDKFGYWSNTDSGEIILAWMEKPSPYVEEK